MSEPIGHIGYTTETVGGRDVRCRIFKFQVRESSGYPVNYRLESIETNETVALYTADEWTERSRVRKVAQGLRIRLERLDKVTRRRVLLASLGYVPAHFSALAAGELARLDRAVLGAEKREYIPA